jgi:hypothetical protein
MAQQARRQGGVADRHFAVDLDRGAGALEAVRDRRVGILRQPGGGCVPERGERPAGPALGESADLLFQREDVLPDALGVAAARGGGQAPSISPESDCTLWRAPPAPLEVGAQLLSSR